MFGRMLVGRPWEDVMFAGAVLANVVLTLTVGVEIAQGAPARLLVATVVVLLLSFPWTNWAQTTALEARRQRETRQREQRIVGSVEKMKASLTTEAPTPPPAPPGNYQRYGAQGHPDAPDPWEE